MSPSRTLRRTALFAFALALSGAVSGGAMAQEAPPAEDDNGQIVVTGTRDSEREVADFVNVLTPPPIGGQLSRFNWAVCPVAAGMAPSQKPTVARRIRSVAKAAGIPVAGEKCTPNLVVIVTPDKNAFIADLARRHPGYFDSLTRLEKSRLSAPGTLAAAWHLKGPPLTADGTEIVNDSDGGVPVNRTTRAGSRIGFAARPQFAAAIVVIESGALNGLTTTQLADYAAMRTLVSTDPARLGKSTAPTILRVLEAPMGSEVPLSLTAWDLGMLRAFYASNPRNSARTQGSDIRTRLEGELTRGN